MQVRLHILSSLKNYKFNVPLVKTLVPLKKQNKKKNKNVVQHKKASKSTHDFSYQQLHQVSLHASYNTIQVISRSLILSLQLREDFIKANKMII